jgi:hypothetical protein
MISDMRSKRFAGGVELRLPLYQPILYNNVKQAGRCTFHKANYHLYWRSRGEVPKARCDRFESWKSAAVSNLIQTQTHYRLSLINTERFSPTGRPIANDWIQR